MRRGRFAILLSGFMLATALAACGGGGGNNDETEIKASIDRAITSGKPTACKKFETLGFMEQTTQTAGKEALKACEEHVSEVKDNPKAVAVTRVTVDGSKGTAQVTFTGGGFDKQTVLVTLAKEGEQWKLDKIKRIVKLDKASLVKQFETQLSDPRNSISKKTVSCFVKKMEGQSQEELEELVLSGSTEPVSQLIEQCS